MRDFSIALSTPEQLEEQHLAVVRLLLVSEPATGWDPSAAEQATNPLVVYLQQSLAWHMAGSLHPLKEGGGGGTPSPEQLGWLEPREPARGPARAECELRLLSSWSAGSHPGQPPPGYTRCRAG